MSKVELVVTGSHYTGGEYTETFHDARYSKLSDEELCSLVGEIYNRYNRFARWNEFRGIVSIIRVIEDNGVKSKRTIL